MLKNLGIVALTILLLSNPSSPAHSASPSSNGSSRFSTMLGYPFSGSPNFTVTVYPLSQTVRIGDQASYQVEVNSTNGFNGTVTLHTEKFAPELLAAFNPTNLSLTSNSHMNSTFTVNTISVGEEAFYLFEVVGVSGSLTNRAAVSLTVLATSAPPSIISYGFLAAVLVFAVIVLWYGIRNRRRSRIVEQVESGPKPPPV